jgi:hypothetical protein
MCKPIFIVPFYRACGTQFFASSIATPRGYKAGSHSCATYNFPHDLSQFPCLLPMAEKKERQRNRSRKWEGVVELIGCHISVPAHPWRSWVGPRWRPGMSTCKT